jgi:hypothetical protein
MLDNREKIIENKNKENKHYIYYTGIQKLKFSNNSFMGQDMTCYGTCICKPLDMIQPLQGMHKLSSPSPIGMAYMTRMHVNNPATATQLLASCPAAAHVLIFLPNADFVLLLWFHLFYFPLLDLNDHVLLINMKINIVKKTKNMHEFVTQTCMKISTTTFDTLH